MDTQLRGSNSKWHLGQRKQIPVKITGKQRRAKFREAKISQICRRRLQQRRLLAKSPRKKVGVLKRREAAKRRHESGFDADTQTSPIGKEVTTSPH
jgi:hypothetical protein